MPKEVIGKRNRDRQPHKPHVVRSTAVDWDHKRVSTQRLIDILLEQGVIDDDDEPTIVGSPTYGEAVVITIEMQEEGEALDLDINSGSITVCTSQ